MELAMPVDGPPGTVADNRAMTICLAADKQLLCYRGTSEAPERVQNISVAALRNLLLSESRYVFQRSGKGLIVLVKPANSADFGTLVDVLDELAIANISSYSITDPGVDDRKLLRLKNLL
jgi:hypothetical protein